MKIKVKKLNPNAKLPNFSTPYAAGADLYALTEKDIVINPHQTVFVTTGLSFEIPDGYAGLVYARSGLASKNNLAPANKVGVIDSDYRGEAFVALHNHGQTPQTVSNGQRIAQLIVMPIPAVEYEETTDLSQTERGSGGFGSSGKF